MLAFIDPLKGTSLEGSRLSVEEIYWLQHLKDPLSNLRKDIGLCVSLELYLGPSGDPQRYYTTARDVMLCAHPEDNILSYDKVKRLACNISSIIELKIDMCIDPCTVFSGLWKDHDNCYHCHKSCWQAGPLEKDGTVGI